MGVLLDVVSAFLALLSSTLIQSSMQLADGALNDIMLLTRPEVLGFHQFLVSEGIYSLSFVKSPLGLEFASEIVKTVGTLSAESHEPLGIQSRVRINTSPVTILKDIDKSIRVITRLRIIGYAAGTATLLGILCFLFSVVCLAKVTQPLAVWICAIAACSTIVVFPMLNWLLDMFNLRMFRSLTIGVADKRIYRSSKCV
jgi:hypothetical protein